MISNPNHLCKYSSIKHGSIFQGGFRHAHREKLFLGITQRCAQNIFSMGICHDVPRLAGHASGINCIRYLKRRQGFRSKLQCSIQNCKLTKRVERETIIYLKDSLKTARHCKYIILLIDFLIG